jgi:hypothetical protein
MIRLWHAHRHRSRLCVLAVLPVLDVVVGQVQGQWGVQIGPVSPAQLFHGTILVYLVGFLLHPRRSLPRRCRFVATASCIFGATVALSMLPRVLQREVLFDDCVSLSQIVYWLLLWPAAVIVCQDPRRSERVLRGVAVAGLYASLSIIVLFVYGGGAYTRYLDVASSFGGWGTAKGLTGPLLCAGIACLWLYRDRRRLLGVIGFAWCIVALLLTQQRTGQVAVASSTLALVGWYFLHGRSVRGGTRALTPALLVLGAAAVTISAIGLEGFQKRWQDLEDPDKAGSGRLVFWQTAGRAYGGFDLPTKLVGVGYSGTLDLLEKGVGARRHTHSDLFDVLLMFGAVGVVGWTILNIAFVRLLFLVDLKSLAFAYALPVMIFLFTANVLTGQMFGPHTMSFYLLTVTALVCQGAVPPAEATPGGQVLRASFCDVSRPFWTYRTHGPAARYR